MADELAEFELTRVPCEANDFNSGRCRITPMIAEKIKGKINSPVRIAVESGFVLCSLWPRSDGINKFLQFDTLVTLRNNPRVCQINNSPIKKNISSDDIVVIETFEAKSVVISLYLSNSAEDFDHGMTQVTRENRRERISRNLLRGLAVIQGCVVEPRECRNSHSSSKKIKKIIIIATDPPTASSGNNAAKVTDKTVITVKSVRRGCYLESENTQILAGLDDAEKELQEVLKYPFHYPECFQHLGLECPKGILLQGAPGVGKTLLVKSVTFQCNAQLIILNGADVFGPHPGESEENLRQKFEIARNASQHDPCVLFIDELDALCPKRGNNGNEQENRIVAQLLTLLDGLESRGKLVVIGATNRPNAIDPALRRPGRLDREIVIGVPNALQRLSILEAHTSSFKLAEEVDLSHLAELTVGYVGADIASLCREAAYVAMKRMLNFSSSDSSDIVTKVTMADFQLALCHIVPSMYRGLEGMVEFNSVSWEDIGGLQDVKQALKQAIEWPLKYPQSFERLGLKRPRGVLLYGPPGCCKTTLVRAASSSCKCTFMALSCAQLYSPYVGDAERKIRELFTKARATAPSILFLDELDAIVGKRSGTSSTGVEARLLSTLLNEMDGIGVLANIYQAEEGKSNFSLQTKDSDSCSEQLMRTELGSVEYGNAEISQKTRRLNIISSSTVKDVLVVAATNRPDAIDEALLRPGRIDRIIYVPPPDVEARLQILRVHTRSSPLAEDVDLEEFALKTELFSGADLENLCREAALYALEDGGMSVSKVEHKHFIEALCTVKPSLTTTQLHKCKLLEQR
ncbi:ATPase family gene 2 protein homolog B [Pocillopora verrucosa]|uniref:ATPase family gene 2 protein homolog B n=1 Tax=Pocillopora verrucosa TaxID=203993 RepID=UPI00333FA7A4